MTFAAHTNIDVLRQRRMFESVDTPLPALLGSFRHGETGVHFEYAERRHPDVTFAPDYQQMIYVADVEGRANTRLAKVHKTVAYIVVDEDAAGQPVVERWPLKGHRIYDPSYLASWN